MTKFICCGFLLIAALAGCASSKVTAFASQSGPKPIVHVIAFEPGGGLLADAVGVELANRGFTVIDGATTSTMLVRLGINEIEVSQPQGLSKLTVQGVDALLSVRSSGGSDQLPQSVSARMNGTADGRILVGVTWQNGWGGRAGSMADRTMRKGLAESASEIADALAIRLDH